MLLQIRPNDTMFFGKGKPFNVAENSWVQSYTMPMPSVFWGAIYSAILSKDDTLWGCIQKYSNFFDKKGEPITVIPGYIPPETFLPILKYIKQEWYLKKISFKEFLKKQEEYEKQKSL